MIGFFRELFSDPAMLLGLAIAIGLIIQKDKNGSDVLRGTFKGIFGFLILVAGAGTIVGSLESFGKLFEQIFNVRGIVPNNEVFVSTAIGKFGKTTGAIMIGGMAVNIFIARFTKWKYIFLTGHHTLFMSMILAIVLDVAGLTGFTLILCGSLVTGFTMTFFPAIAQPYMRKVTGGDDIALGHLGTIGYITSIYVGKLVGKGSKSTEDIAIPKGLGFLRDSSVSTAIAMGIIYLVTSIAAGPEFINGTLGVSGHYILWAIKQALTFAAGLIIILTGVRLIITEITPAFKGIADKIVPGAIPALDCPVTFPFAENAVIIGFMSTLLGGLIGMFIQISMGSLVVVPGLIPHFFLGATAGVLTNKVGGRRGVVIGGIIQGLMITFLPVLLLPFMGELGFANTTFNDTDFIVAALVMGSAAKKGAAVAIGVSVALFSIPFIANMVGKKR